MIILVPYPTESQHKCSIRLGITFRFHESKGALPASLVRNQKDAFAVWNATNNDFRDTVGGSQAPPLRNTVNTQRFCFAFLDHHYVLVHSFNSLACSTLGCSCRELAVDNLWCDIVLFPLRH